MTVKQFREKYGVFISTRLSGKMNGIPALTTSCLKNKYCMQRAADTSTICSACYSVTALTSGRRNEAAAAYERNTDILTREIIPVDEWPVINAQYFRLESHGGLNNDIQFINYINFAARNQRTGCKFALWTKNPGIIERVFKDGYSKPKNMIIICSSPFLNNPVNKEKYLEQWPFIDKFFTVYTADYIQQNNVSINCGARDCLSCARCYNKRTGRGINEKLKK